MIDQVYLKRLQEHKFINKSLYKRYIKPILEKMMRLN